jgi:hypothetical protein
LRLCSSTNFFQELVFKKLNNLFKKMIKIVSGYCFITGKEMIVSPKRAALLCILPILVGSTIVWGVKTMTPSEGTPMEITEVSAVEYPLKLVMRLNKTEYEPGELITIDLKLINIGNSTVKLVFLGCCYKPWFRFKLYNISDSLVFESGEAAFHMVTEVFLGAKDYIGFTHEWNQTVSRPLMPVCLLEPGTYKIIGFLDTLSTPGVTLETPPIQISVG